MSMLRAAYEVFDNTHMATMKQLVAPYNITETEFKQLLGDLSLPSMHSEFVGELKTLYKRTDSDPASLKFQFVYYAVSMCHLFYASYDPKLGLYCLVRDSKPVFYEYANNTLSYIWLACDSPGMLTCVQSYFATRHMPNKLDVTVKRATRMGDMLPLRFDLPVEGDDGNTTTKTIAYLKINVHLDHRRLKLIGVDTLFLKRSFALLLTFGMVFNSLHMVCAGECELKQMPVALHSLGP